ncbi:MAG TPA: IclR family transcriptional regulator [Firmicutes bacterium]|nr:IclR family transcriptional regulator [Bacillota bacterium]
MTKNRRDDSVKTLEKGLEILEALADEEYGMSVANLARKVGLPLSTTYRLVRTLLDRGYVEQSRETRKYSIGLKVLQLKGRVLSQKRLGEQAMPVLKDLAQKSGEMVHLVVYNQGEVVYVNTVESLANPGLYTQVGSRAPCHCTAVGKVLLAFLDEREVDRVIAEKGLPRRTPKTITSPEELKRCLQMVGAQGYAIDDEEANEGYRCIAAPIWDYSGKVIAAISISGPATRVSPARDGELIPLVKSAADEISYRLGHIRKERVASGMH